MPPLGQNTMPEPTRYGCCWMLFWREAKLHAPSPRTEHLTWWNHDKIQWQTWIQAVHKRCQICFFTPEKPDDQQNQERIYRLKDEHGHFTLEASLYIMALVGELEVPAHRCGVVIHSCSTSPRGKSSRWGSFIAMLSLPYQRPCSCYEQGSCRWGLASGRLSWSPCGWH